MTEEAQTRPPGSAIQDAEERSEARVPLHVEAEMRVLYPTPGPRQKVRVLNTSSKGVGVIARRKLDRGAIVQLQRGDLLQWGEVRHCTRVGAHQFQIGVRVQEEDRLSRIRESNQTQGNKAPS
jgi:hypothetical protein